MRRVVSSLAIVAAVIWSLIAWGVYALTGWVGGLMATNADAFTSHPETVVWLSGFASFLTGLGLFGVGFVWFLGLAAIGLGALVLRLIVGRRPASHAGSRH